MVRFEKDCINQIRIYGVQYLQPEVRRIFFAILCSFTLLDLILEFGVFRRVKLLIITVIVFSWPAAPLWFTNLIDSKTDC